MLILTILRRWVPQCKILLHIDPCNDRETTRQRPLPGSGTHATMEVLLKAVFSMWSTSRLYHATDRVQLVHCSAVQRSEELLGDLVTERIAVQSL
jgi:hypothetical protein